MKKMILAIGTMAVAFTAAPTAVQAQNAQTCREFTRDIVIDGKAVEAFGTACLQGDGSWRIVSNQEQSTPQSEVGQEVIFVEPKRERIHHPYVSARFGKKFGYGKSYYGHKSYKSHRKHHGKKYAYKKHHGSFKKHY